mmetsp:Transcript_23915/g.80732  ORF Transcript_23915/g.80732 Transcript_23915/m.80732 type:complete len:294 (+) Transcript_23915:785-1666(+)
MQQLTGVNAILSYGPAIFQTAEVPLSALACAVVTNSFNLVGTIVMMLVIDRLGRRFLLLVGAAAMFLFMSLSAVLAYNISSATEDSPYRATMGWCLLACICLYMASFAVAWGGVPWVYPSEIFPMSVKEKAMSTSVCSQWSANFLIAYIVPLQVQSWDVYGTFFFYTCCLAVTFCLVYALIPETNGLELEQMDALFGSVDSPLVIPILPIISLPHADSHACSLAGLGSMSTPTLPSYQVTVTRAGESTNSLMGSIFEGGRRWRSSTEGDLLEQRVWKSTARVFMSRSGAVALY